jgi:hypothetical protein
MSLESLRIPGKIGRYFIPQVDFDAESGVCLLEGESYLDDTYKFYERLWNWIGAYFEDGREEIEIRFKMRFFSTSSSRAIFELLKTLKEWENQGKKVKIKWLYPHPDDEELLIDGEDFAADSGLTFEYIKYEIQDSGF